MCVGIISNYLPSTLKDLCNNVPHGVGSTYAALNSLLTICFLSAEGKKANKSSYKRRKDQNSEISELEALLPWSQKGAGIDKISVLRLTSTLMKFRDFWDSCELCDV